jgi:winged helix DNA-binding protein
MLKRDIATQRLANHGISAPRFESPEALVGWLGAVQAQEYDVAKWSLGQRSVSETDATVEQALAEGRILRTHVLRPTWHFVTPRDIRWLLELTAPRVRRLIAYYDRLLEIDESLRKRSYSLIERALLEAGKLTRAEVAKVLSAGGIDASGQRLSHFLFHAELSCVICSGPRKGKQHTYALFAERAPAAQSMPRDDSLAELARRFFASHGPATPKDFSTWCSLTLTDARKALAMLGPEAESFEADGRTYWQAAEAARPGAEAPRAHLLQGYDEYIMGYSESKDVLRDESWGNGPAGQRPPFTHALIIDGTVAGHWRRNVAPKAVAIDLQLYRPLTAEELQEVDDAVQRYAGFIGLPVSIGSVQQPEA